MIKLLTAIALLFLFSTPAFASDPKEILVTCAENRSHVEMSNCIQGVVEKSELTLKAAETTLENRFSGGEDEPEFLARAKKEF